MKVLSPVFEIFSPNKIAFLPILDESCPMIIVLVPSLVIVRFPNVMVLAPYADPSEPIDILS